MACYAAHEGAVNLDQVLRCLLAQAIANGVCYYPHHTAQQLLESGRQIYGVKSEHKQFYADQVVLCAGIGQQNLLASLQLKLGLACSPAILLKFQNKTQTRWLNHIISSPEMELRQFAPGEIWAAEDYIDDQPQHHVKHIAAQALQTIQQHFHHSEHLQLKHYAVGQRPMPDDAMPIVGNIAEGLYILNSHAAVTLAPLLCDLASREILTGQLQSQLQAYRPQRCLNKIV